MKNSYLKPDVYFYLYLFLITFFSIFSQYLFKDIDSTRVSNKNYLYLVLGLLMYALTGYFIYKLLPYGNLLILNVIWHIVYFIVLFLVGYLLFKEKITFTKMFALILGIISLIIFMFEGVH